MKFLFANGEEREFKLDALLVGINSKYKRPTHVAFTQSELNELHNLPILELDKTIARIMGALARDF